MLSIELLNGLADLHEELHRIGAGTLDTSVVQSCADTRQALVEAVERMGTGELDAVEIANMFYSQTLPAFAQAFTEARPGIERRRQSIYGAALDYRASSFAEAARSVQDGSGKMVAPV